MQIEEGGCYRTRDGQRAGPVRWRPSPFISHGGYWISDDNPGGWYFPGTVVEGDSERPNDLIAPWPTETEHLGAVSLDQTDVIIPTMSPEEALQELAAAERPLRVQILNSGAALTHGQRDREYGPPRVNMAAAGALKKAFRDHMTRDIDPAELEAIDMVLTKLGRIATGTPKLDTYVDGSTYFAIAGEIALTPTTQTEAYSATDI